MITNKDKAIFIIGQTATSKTELSLKLANDFNGEIISVDSRQVYKKLNYGTGKDYHVINQFPQVKVHLIDICHYNDKYNLFTFKKDAYHVFQDLKQRLKKAFFVGGSSLYFSSLINDYQLKNYNNENQIVSFKDVKLLLLAPYYGRKIVHQRIADRLHNRWDKMKKEVKQLLDDGMSFQRLDFLGLEYRYLAKYFKKELKEEQCFQQLYIKICQFARRQDIWMRKLERQGHEIFHLEQEDKFQQAKEIIDLFLNNETLPKIKIRLKDIDYSKLKTTL